jgi:hypothetical protein
VAPGEIVILAIAPVALELQRCVSDPELFVELSTQLVGEQLCLVYGPPWIGDHVGRERERVAVDAPDVDVVDCFHAGVSLEHGAYPRGWHVGRSQVEGEVCGILQNVQGPCAHEQGDDRGCGDLGQVGEAGEARERSDTGDECCAEVGNAVQPEGSRARAPSSRVSHGEHWPCWKQARQGRESEQHGGY